MNKYIGLGRLTREPDVRYTQGNEPIAVARYTLAIDRPVKKEGEQTADFISCVAFGKNAEFAEKYLKKGTKILIEGRIQTGSYTNNDGQRVYTTEVVVEHHEFAESKGSDGFSKINAPIERDTGFMNVPEGIDDDLPFAQPTR